jgi:hypothetical protein
VGNHVIVGMSVEPAGEVGEVHAAEDGREAIVEAMDVVAPADAKHG